MADVLTGTLAGGPGHLKETRILETLGTLRGLQRRKVESRVLTSPAWQEGGRILGENKFHALRKMYFEIIDHSYYANQMQMRS